MPSHISKNIKLNLILTFVITIFIFLFIFSKIEISLVLKVLSESDFILLSFLPPVVIFGVLIQAKIWKIILSGIKYKITLSRSFRIIMATVPISVLTPSKAGEFVRAIYIRDELPITKTLGTVMAEKIVGILCLTILAFVGLSFFPRLDILVIMLIIIFIIALLFIIQFFDLKLPLRKAWSEKIENILSSIKFLSKNPRTFLSVFVFSMIFWFVSIFQVIVIFMALGIDVPVFYVMAAIPLAILIGQIPITLGGMGTRDSAIIILFLGYADAASLLGVGLLFSLFRYWFLAILGLPFMRKYIKT